MTDQPQPQPWTTPQPGSWWVITTTGNPIMALAHGEGPDARYSAIGYTDTGEPALHDIDPADITDATPMAIVDTTWVERARTAALQVIDGQRRLTEIDASSDSAHTALAALNDALATGIATITWTNPDDAGPYASVALQRVQQIRDNLTPTKNGIIA